MSISGAGGGWLAVFGKDFKKSWDDKIYWKTLEYKGKLYTLPALNFLAARAGAEPKFGGAIHLGAAWKRQRGALEFAGRLSGFLPGGRGWAVNLLTHIY
jgi:hypothetical protein